MITSGFGPRWGTMHRGTDFGWPGGSGGLPVYAAQGGTVIRTGASTGFGGPSPAGWVVIDHPTADGSGATGYGHVIAEVAVGQRVEAGQRIARVNPDPATFGDSTAPHLHFFLCPQEFDYTQLIDPAPWLEGAMFPGEQPAAPMPGGILPVIDISEHQDGLWIEQAAREGIVGVILRTNDGTYRDKVFASHLADADKAGIPTAVYFYLRHPGEGTTIRQQVDTLLAQLGGRRLAVWVDVESDKKQLRLEHALEAQDKIREAGLRCAGVYSYYPYWRAMGSPDLSGFEHVWSAAYGPNDAGSPAQLYPGDGGFTLRDGTRVSGWAPMGGKTPTLWQYGSRARVCGREVDINAFRGTPAQLAHLFRPSDDAPTPPQPAPGPPLTDSRKLDLILDQLAGLPDGDGGRSWPQLGGRSLVDAVAAIGENLGIAGFTDPKKSGGQ